MYYEGDLSRALSSLMEAIKERDEARGNCHHSWGYYGQRLEDEVVNRERDFIGCLREAMNPKRSTT